MNKKIRAVIMFAVVALVAGINVYHSQKTVTISDVALANIEALADEEWYNGNCFWERQYTRCMPGGIYEHCPCGSFG